MRSNTHPRHARLAAFVLASAFTGAAAAAATPGVSFTHKDWSVDCDNTGTCRASGYERDESDNPVSVLVTRAAGPDAPLRAQAVFGGDEDKLPRGPVRMSIGGRAMGTVADSKDMSPGQVTALLKAVTGSDEVVFSVGKRLWTLSSEGATAVLLKMDDAQGRIGSPGAVARKGTKPESAVPGPAAVPVIQAVRVPASSEGDLPLALKVLATIPKDGDCDELAALQASKNPDTSDVDVWRLGGGRVLVTALCWRGAYNTGNGYWIANDKPPYDAKLVTTQADTFEPEAGELSGTSKGRGVGDCVSRSSWVWDGRAFVHAHETTSGQCKSVAAGGAWDLPTLVSEVRKPR